MKIDESSTEKPAFFGVSRRTLTNVQGLLHGNQAQSYRILALDGGGVRGLVEAIFLKELANRLPSPLFEYFDLIAGTSIGSVLACSVSMGKDMNEVVTMFQERSKDIFPSLLTMVARKLFRSPLNPFGPPLYDGKGLEKMLQDTFGDALFTGTHLKTLVLIPAYSLTDATPVYMRSDEEDFSRHYIWEICRAACAAPYFFPPFTLRRGESGQVMIDGALFSNNPVGSAFAQAIKTHRLEGIYPVRYLIASLGAVSKNRHANIDLNMGRGNILDWIRWMIYTIFDGNTKDTNLRMQQSVGDEEFFRFQVELPIGYDRIDNVNPKNLQHLIELTYEYLSLPEVKARLDELVEKLSGT